MYGGTTPALKHYPVNTTVTRVAQFSQAIKSFCLLNSNMMGYWTKPFRKIKTNLTGLFIISKRISFHSHIGILCRWEYGMGDKACYQLQPDYSLECFDKGKYVKESVIFCFNNRYAWLYHLLLYFLFVCLYRSLSWKIILGLRSN